MWNRGLCCEKVAATVASIAASPPRPARTQFLELPGTQRLAKWRMRYFLDCRTWRTLADSVTGRPQPSSEVTNPKTRSTTFSNDLPCVNQRGLYTERHLQPDTFCGFANSLDGCFHDSPPLKFDERAVADFVFGHGCGFLYHAMPGIRTSTLRLTAEELQNLNALFGVAYRETR